MEQNQKYQRFSALGISLVTLFFLFNSCERKVDNDVTCQYIYKNSSDYLIDMKVFNSSSSLIDEYSISVNDSIIINLKGEGGVGPFQFNTMESQQGDSVVVLFANLRYLTYNKGYGLLLENFYTIRKKSDTKIILKYTFTNDDFNDANPVK